MSVPEMLAPSGDAYVLRVRGDSMVDAHIADGDFVVIRPQQTARNGDIVVAQVEENAVTLKRFFREKGRVRLQPANEAYPPHVLPRRPDPGQAHRGHPPGRLTESVHKAVHTRRAHGRRSVDGSRGPSASTRPRRCRRTIGLHRLSTTWSQCVHRPSATAIHRGRAIGPRRPAHRP